MHITYHGTSTLLCFWLQLKFSYDFRMSKPKRSKRLLLCLVLLPTHTRKGCNRRGTMTKVRIREQNIKFIWIFSSVSNLDRQVRGAKINPKDNPFGDERACFLSKIVFKDSCSKCSTWHPKTLYYTYRHKTVILTGASQLYSYTFITCRKAS